MMKKRMRDEVDPLIVALRERDAKKAADVAVTLAKLSPEPPMEHIGETIECIEGVLMRLSTDAEGFVTAVLNCVSADHMSFVIPPELVNDRWWLSVCQWDAKRPPIESKHGVAIHEDTLSWYKRQDNLVSDALKNAWLDAHPNSAFRYDMADGTTIIRVSVSALEMPTATVVADQ